jgi:hypothetical protein
LGIGVWGRTAEWKIKLWIGYTGVQGKNNEYHIVDRVENSFIDALIFDLIDNVLFVDFALYSSIHLILFSNLTFRH